MLLVGLGGLLMFVGAVWLVVVAIQTGKTTGEKVLWALVNFFCNPLGGIVFFIVRKQGLVPMLIAVVGFLLYMGGIFTNREMLQMMR